MKRIAAGVLLASLTCACTVNPPKESSNASPAGKSAELEGLTLQWMEAMLRHDRTRLEELMSPEYVLHTPDPKHPEIPRAIWLDNLFNNLKIDRWEQTNISAHVYGIAGVVTSTYSWSGTMQEKAFESKGHCTDVWRSRNKRWQVVSRTCMAFPGSVTLSSPTN